MQLAVVLKVHRCAAFSEYFTPIAPALFAPVGGSWLHQFDDFVSVFFSLCGCLGEFCSLSRGMCPLGPAFDRVNSFS